MIFELFVYKDNKNLKKIPDYYIDEIMIENRIDDSFFQVSNEEEDLFDKKKIYYCEKCNNLNLIKRCIFCNSKIEEKLIEKDLFVKKFSKPLTKDGNVLKKTYIELSKDRNSISQTKHFYSFNPGNCTIIISSHFYKLNKNFIFFRHKSELKTYKILKDGVNSFFINLIKIFF